MSPDNVKDILDMDPWEEADIKDNECYHCKKPIGKKTHIWVNERDEKGKPTGKMIYFHYVCFKDGRDIKRLEKKEDDKHEGKLITEDFDKW